MHPQPEWYVRERSERYQRLIDRVGIDEARRIGLERCHRTRIRNGKMSPDGPRVPKTREEKLATRRAWAEKNREHLRGYAREFYAKNADQLKQRMSEQYRKGPEKWHARAKALAALRSGEIVKSSICSMCTRSGLTLEMHHTNYDEPLQIEWLCRRCHRRLHAALKGHVPRGRTANEEVRKAKQAARDTFYRAIRAREVVRPESCSRCGSTEKIEAHHTDYSRPLEVEWLCRSCHRGLGHTQSRGNTEVAVPGSAPVVNGAGTRGSVSGFPGGRAGQ